jgi:signal transduction histidine kinase
VEFLSSKDATVPPALVTQRQATDRAMADFRRSAASDDARDAASETLQARIRQIFADLDALPANRDHIDDREVDVVGAQGMYNMIIDTGFAVFAATGTFNSERIDREARALTTIGRGQEYLSRADAMLAGANAAGQMQGGVRDELLESIHTARFLLAEGVHDMPAQDRTAYTRLTTGEAMARLRGLQDNLVSQARADAPSPVTAQAWQPAYDTSAQQLRAFEMNATESLADRARPIAVGVLVRLGAAGLVGLIALIASIIVSVRVGRSIIGRLRRLRGEALEMAGERLPSVVRRLQRGEVVDVDVETPPLEYGKDEIGEVGHAFNEVQRTAVQSAVDEANVRRGINEVFLNIARRSQTLLHRQLALLDRMERRETGPEELEDLFRVDHLATRMRRHAEDLVILAGAAPGRGWRNPVPLIDVVRGAISEVEDYKRIDIRSVETAAVLGRAVGDVIHLLAELLENATSFSPPQTRVEVSGQVLPNGYAVEIEDRGLGMSPQALDEANRKLTEPPDFDPADSARLGLFVVAQLANRHQIKVSLRSSAYGGITGIVLIPGDLIAGPGPLALPAGPSSADRSWDRPLVGSGKDDPSRRSLAALQWQGAEELRSITVPGRPVVLDGGPAGVGPAAIPPPTPAAPAPPGDPTPSARPTAGGVFGDSPAGSIPQQRSSPGGPTPSAVADALTAEGLVQRRRAVPRQQPAPPTETETETEDGLPKRVRRASLAPQLRNTAPEDTQSLRSPEQIRNLMSALQRGTTRGRLDAAGIGSGGPWAGFAEAATVSLPVVRDRGLDRNGAGPEQSTGENDATRPEKDA